MDQAQESTPFLGAHSPLPLVQRRMHRPGSQLKEVVHLWILVSNIWLVLLPQTHFIGAFTTCTLLLSLLSTLMDVNAWRVLVQVSSLEMVTHCTMYNYIIFLLTMWQYEIVKYETDPSFILWIGLMPIFDRCHRLSSNTQCDGLQHFTQGSSVMNRKSDKSQPVSSSGKSGIDEKLGGSFWNSLHSWIFPQSSLPPAVLSVVSSAAARGGEAGKLHKHSVGCLQSFNLRFFVCCYACIWCFR